VNHAEFILAFEECSYPRADWVHASHIRVAWIYCSKHDVVTALKNARDGIKAYNASVGGSPDLYHETITTFYIRTVNHRLSSQNGFTWEQFMTENPDLMNWWPSLIEQYYTKELLYSGAARQKFVLPDRQSLEFQI
jgi:hypothetical protein